MPSQVAALCASVVFAHVGTCGAMCGAMVRLGAGGRMLADRHKIAGAIAQGGVKKKHRVGSRAALSNKRSEGTTPPKCGLSATRRHASAQKRRPPLEPAKGGDDYSTP